MKNSDPTARPSAIAAEPNPDRDFCAANGVEVAELDEMLPQADVLTVHAPLTEATRHIIGARELALLPAHAVVINTSRGPIIEEQALINVLKNKQIAGAAIDVFDVEPLAPDHPFRTLDNILATPHIAYVSQGLYKTFYEDTVSNIREWLDTR